MRFSIIIYTTETLLLPTAIDFSTWKPVWETRTLC